MTKRLLFVRRAVLSSLILVGLVLSGVGSSPAVAGGLIAQQSPVEVEVSAGLDGLVEATEPVEVAVQLTAEVLFTGWVEISAGASDVVATVEVPAGSTKTYRIVAPPPASSDLRLIVRVFDDAGDRPLVVERLRLRSPDVDRVVVGVLGMDPPAALGRTLTAIGDVQLESIRVDEATASIDVLDYLVAGDSELPEVVTPWLVGGGRLIGPPGVGDSLGIALEPIGRFPQTDIDWFRAGEGEVLAGTQIADDEWTQLIRPRVRRYPNVGEPMDAQLMRAASAGEEQRIPSISWLLGAIVMYALVAGPAMFFVLGRMKRRELAWLVGPIVSVLALGGFWLFGRQQLADSFAGHATVVIAGDEPRWESAVVLAAGTAGAHEIAVPGAATLYAAQVQEFGNVAARGVVNGDSIRFDLAQLGFAGARARLPAGDATLDVTVTADEVTVTNNTGFEIIGWGVMAGTNGIGGSGRLDPGASGSLRRPRRVQDFGFLNPFELVGPQIGSDGQAWDRWYPLGDFAGSVTSGSYAFAFVSNFEVDAVVDGSARRLDGPAMFVTPIDDLDAVSDRSTGQLLATGTGGFVEPIPNDVFVSGSEMIVEFRVPTDVRAPVLEFRGQMGGPPDTIEFWDWEELSFVEGEWGAVPSSAVLANGTVVLRAGRDAEFGEPMAPSDLSIVWSSA